ncbi:MAG: 5'/3'-nucleotidase SurE [Treponema sp.]|jgi:5'-nucleotidase|nr:5'/3'-nucleotidase SurE [Treponema sp.]
MRILLTNDDGIASPGIVLLAAALREAGHRVFVVAPASDRSGVSHAISFLNGPCKLVEIEKDTWACYGTPVDCIVIALRGGIPDLCMAPGQAGEVESAPPDAVISGINRGANIGTDILYSGTAAAARQAALCGIPSLALSLVEGAVWNWDMAVIFAVERLEEMLSCWKPGSFVNVNIPNRREIPSSLAHAFPCIRCYNDRIEVYHAPDGHRYCFSNAGESCAKPEQGSDWEAVEENSASLSEIFIHPVLLESIKGRET